MYGIKYKVLADLETEPVTDEFFRFHCRIDFNLDDALLPTYITAARQYLEQWSQLSFGVKTIQLTALKLPCDYELMYGPVASLGTTSDSCDTTYTLFGNIVREGGTDVTIEYVTEGIDNDTIKVAICRYAAGLYASRYNILTDDKGNPVNGANMQDEAKMMIKPFANISLF